MGNGVVEGTSNDILRQLRNRAIVAAAAGQTQVSATLVDNGGTTWANAAVTINFVPAPNIPGPYMWQGGPFNIMPKLTADGNGYFSIALPDSTTITPAGSMWQFVIAPNATMPAVVFQLQCAGTSMDISSIFSSQSYQVQNTLVQSLALPRAYSDSEVATPSNPGQLYYNATSHSIKFYTSGAWYSLPGGGWTTLADNTDANNLPAGSGNVHTVNGFTNGPPTTPRTNQVINSLVLLQFGASQDDTTGALYYRTWHSGGWGTWAVV